MLMTVACRSTHRSPCWNQVATLGPVSKSRAATHQTPPGRRVHTRLVIAIGPGGSDQDSRGGSRCPAQPGKPRGPTRRSKQYQAVRQAQPQVAPSRVCQAATRSAPSRTKPIRAVLSCAEGQDASGSPWRGRVASRPCGRPLRLPLGPSTLEPRGRGRAQPTTGPTTHA